MFVSPGKHITLKRPPITINPVMQAFSLQMFKVILVLSEGIEICNYSQLETFHSLHTDTCTYEGPSLIINPILHSCIYEQLHQ